MPYQVFMGELPPALNVNNGSAGAVAAGDTPCVLGVDADSPAGEVSLARKHGVCGGVDGWGRGAAECLAAGDFVIPGEILQELGDVGVTAVLWWYAVRELDLEPGGEIYRFVGWVQLGRSVNHGGEFLRSDAVDKWEDVKYGVSFCETCAGLCFANKISDKLWPRN